MTLYGTLRQVYKTFIPARFRQSATDRNSVVFYLVNPIKSLVWRLAQHDQIYDEKYYSEIMEPLAKKSAAVMAESIVSEFHPSFVVDVGCGAGELLRQLKDRGIQGVGYEKSAAAIRLAHAKDVEVLEFDLEQPLDRLAIRPSDLVISTEVAEHLPKRFADTYVEYLCRTADRVLMTAAIPGQGGTEHVNEQPNEYWIAKFQQRGFSLDREMTDRLRRRWQEASIAGFYYSNLMIFRKS
jgi:SAM-dependent methyltransferase